METRPDAEVDTLASCRFATVEDLLERARHSLTEASFGPSRREASLLLSRVLGWSEARVMSRGEEKVSWDLSRQFDELIRRRVAGEPVAYLLGEKEFFGRRFAVDPRVLVPRPETEHLIESVLALDLSTTPRILDIGTGSGCIAVTLALELPGARVVATDLSLAALAVARLNCENHGVAGRVALAVSDLGRCLDLDQFDVVVSNPPYVDPGDAEDLSPEITGFEPTSAVFAPERGDSIIRRLVTDLEGVRSGCPVLMEIGSEQSDTVRESIAVSGFELLEIRPDLAGHPRIAIARRLHANG